MEVHADAGGVFYVGHDQSFEAFYDYRSESRRSFMHVTTELLGAEMMVGVLTHTGPTAQESEVLKMSVSTPVSS